MKRKPVEWDGAVDGALQVPELLQRIEDFRAHRREIRKPITPKAGEALARKLAAWGVSRSIAAIEHTIANGWQGIREPDLQRTSAGRQFFVDPAEERQKKIDAANAERFRLQRIKDQEREDLLAAEEAARNGKSH